jgi:hypothetical protein
MYQGIKPSDINIERHLWGAFGKYETEVSARWIVEFCQARGGDSWRSFTYKELETFYHKTMRAETGKESFNGYFRFNGLEDEPWYIEQSQDKRRFKISSAFIRKCWMASPKEAKKDFIKKSNR